MKVTSSVRSTESKSCTDSESRREVTRSGVCAAILFAATLALAPLPTFAQHGGGGGGGGAHGGGGGMGGGSHASSGVGGGSHVTTSSSGSGSASGHATTSTATGSGGNAGTSVNHWWNPFHSNSTTSAGNPPVERFAAGNNTWVEPPARGVHDTTGAVATNNVRGVSTGMRPEISSPPHIPVVPRRPIIFAPFNPFFPFGFFGPGFGFGFGGFYGAFGPCDPFWGCYGYGFGDNGGYGYYGGSFSGYGADLSYSGSEDMSPGEDSTPSQEMAPTLFAQSPETPQGEESATAEPAAKPVTAVLYLKDGSSYAVTDYWLADGKIHYITSYGGENSVDQSALDLQRTVDENAAQGLTFTLRPATVSTRGAVVVPQ